MSEAGHGVHERTEPAQALSLVDVVPSGRASRLSVPAGDPEAIAQAVSALVDDAEARPAAAADGRLWKHRLGAASVSPAFEALYERVVGGATA